MKITLFILSLVGFVLGGAIVWSALKTLMHIIYLSQHSLALSSITSIAGHTVSITLRILISLFAIFPISYRLLIESIYE